MYANYLIDVGKLVFIVGDTDSTTQFRNLFQSPATSKYPFFIDIKIKNILQMHGIITNRYIQEIKKS